MKRSIATALIVMTLPFAACTTTVAARPVPPRLVLVEGRWVKPPRAGALWVGGHWERRGFHKVWVPGHWR